MNKMKCLITENQSGNVVILSKGGEYQSKITESEIFKDWISESQKQNIRAVIQKNLDIRNYGTLKGLIFSSLKDDKNNLFIKNHTKPVVRRISIDKVVQEIFSKPITNLVNIQEFLNENGNKDVKFTASVSGNNTVSIRTSLTTTDTNNSGFEIGLGLEISGFKFSPSFNTGLAKSESKMEDNITADSTVHNSAAVFTLKPNEKAIVALKNDEYEVNARIVYSIRLSGLIYAISYKDGQNFYSGYDIEEVMKEANISNQQKIEQELNISGYLRSNVIFK